jgi:hypothetical protein
VGAVYWFQCDDFEINNMGTQTYALTEIEVFDPLATTGIYERLV